MAIYHASKIYNKSPRPDEETNVNESFLKCQKECPDYHH